MLPALVQILFCLTLLKSATVAFPGECSSTLAVSPSQIPPEPSPQPTSPPKYKADLIRRDIVNYCGYVTQDLDQGIGCSAGYTCAVNTDYNVGGCCSDTASCSLPTTCVQAWAATESDSLAITCSDPDRYCFTGFYVGGDVSPSAFGCTDTMKQNPVIYPTYPGGPLPVTTALVGNGLLSESVDSDPSTASTSTSTTTSRPKSKKKTNIGAIVGGVVGGIAALTLLVVAVVLLLVRRRNRKRTSAQSYPNFDPHVGPQQPYQPVPQGPIPPQGPPTQVLQPPMQQVESYKVDPTLLTQPAAMSNKQDDTGAVHRSPSPKPAEQSPLNSPRLSSATATVEPPAPASPTAPAPAYSPEQSYSSTFSGPNGPHEASSQTTALAMSESSSAQPSHQAVAAAGPPQEPVFEAPSEPRNYGPTTYEVATDRPVYEAPNERRTYELGTER